jgi:hypothetical protein
MAALKDCSRLANPQARSYALVGIRALNPSRYKELLRSFRDSKEEVVTQKGCIELHESLAEVLKHIAAGEYSRGK